jgi:hypothetical protein
VGARPVENPRVSVRTVEILRKGLGIELEVARRHPR